MLGQPNAMVGVLALRGNLERRIRHRDLVSLGPRGLHQALRGHIGLSGWLPHRHGLAPPGAMSASGHEHAYGTVCRLDCAERCRATVKDGLSSRTPRYSAKEINVIKALGGQGI